MFSRGFRTYHRAVLAAGVVCKRCPGIARLCNVSQPTVSRIIAQHQQVVRVDREVKGELLPETRRQIWEQIEQLYHGALERSAGQRPGFLDQACGGDEELRREVESLLARDGEGDGFLEAPALEVAAKELAREGSTRLTAGTRLGPYEILALIGVGGMGEVYRARHTRLRLKQR